MNEKSENFLNEPCTHGPWPLVHISNCSELGAMTVLDSICMQR